MFNGITDSFLVEFEDGTKAMCKPKDSNSYDSKPEYMAYETARQLGWEKMFPYTEWIEADAPSACFRLLQTLHPSAWT